MRHRLHDRFISSSNRPMWENFTSAVSIYNPEGWRMIDEYIMRKPFILFFDQEEDATMIEFPEGNEITPVLEDCSGFEFYVTNCETDYILCFNHHDFLIGTGEASKWSALQANKVLS